MQQKSSLRNLRAILSSKYNESPHLKKTSWYTSKHPPQIQWGQSDQLSPKCNESPQLPAIFSSKYIKSHHFESDLHFTP